MHLPVLSGADEAPDFRETLADHGHPRLRRGPVATLQLNVGRRCNQACTHCHVEAGPKRTEMMSPALVEHLVDVVARSPAVQTIDITGGAPELHPDFRRLVLEMRKLGRRVIDRCNLTILVEPGQEDLAVFLADHDVEIVASLPCYSRDNVDRQRGKGVFDRSIAGLRALNALGYGSPGGPRLDLVYNPGGAFLPPAQGALEADYRRELREAHGIVFTQLLTLTNMPIKRFDHQLRRDGARDAYMSLLRDGFNAETVPGLMCRSHLSVSYDGTLYDCDFNQMLELPLPGGAPRRIQELSSLESLSEMPISTGEHCFGCTAGAGSSCGGALTPDAANADP